jgi:hypothetical protein
MPSRRGKNTIAVDSAAGAGVDWRCMKSLRITITLSGEDASAFEYFHKESVFKAATRATTARYLLLMGMGTELSDTPSRRLAIHRNLKPQPIKT